MSIFKNMLSTKIILLEKTKQNRLTLLSSCAICGKNTSRFIKNQESWRLLVKLGMRTPLNNIVK